MKKRLYLIPLLFLLAGCSEKNVPEKNPVPDIMPEFEATIDDADDGTKAELRGLDINWQDEDIISIFVGNTANNKYELKEGSGTTSGRFKLLGQSKTSGTTIPMNGAIYPYAETNTVAATSGDALSFTFDIPAEQKYHAGSFDPDAFPMVAVSNGNNLPFKNVCGILKLSLTGNEKVTKIIVKGNNGQMLAGRGSCKLKIGGTPDDWTFAENNGKTYISLDCSENGGVMLKPENETSFFIVLPPVSFGPENNSGFTVEIYGEEGKWMMKKTAKGLQILRNQILPMKSFKYVPKTQKEIEEYFITEIKNQIKNATKVSFVTNAEFDDVTLLSSPGELVVSTTADEFSLNNNYKDLFHDLNASLTSLDFTNCNTSQMTDMQYLFRNDTQLTELNLSSFNTSKVTNMQNMFENIGWPSSHVNIILGPDFIIDKDCSVNNMFYNAQIKSIKCTQSTKNEILGRKAENLISDGIEWYDVTQSGNVPLN